MPDNLSDFAINSVLIKLGVRKSRDEFESINLDDYRSFGEEGNEEHDLKLLYKDVLDFLAELNSRNSFDEKLYSEIYKQFQVLFDQWAEQDSIPKSAFISCVYLIDELSGGNRSWSEDTCEKVIDALIQMQELITSIDNHPPYPL